MLLSRAPCRVQRRQPSLDLYLRYYKSFPFRTQHFLSSYRLFQVVQVDTTGTMAPTSHELHEMVSKLEARVKELEQKLHESQGGAPKSAIDGRGVRMILMGPPGAGMYIAAPLSWSNTSQSAMLFGQPAKLFLQERAPKLQKSRRNSRAVTL